MSKSGKCGEILKMFATNLPSDRQVTRIYTKKCGAMVCLYIIQQRFRLFAVPPLRCGAAAIRQPLGEGITIQEKDQFAKPGISNSKNNYLLYPLFKSYSIYF